MARQTTDYSKKARGKRLLVVFNVVNGRFMTILCLSNDDRSPQYHKLRPNYKRKGKEERPMPTTIPHKEPSKKKTQRRSAETLIPSSSSTIDSGKCKSRPSSKDHPTRDPGRSTRSTDSSLADHEENRNTALHCYYRV